jgi:hypothetical protein
MAVLAGERIEQLRRARAQVHRQLGSGWRRDAPHRATVSRAGLRSRPPVPRRLAVPPPGPVPGQRTAPNARTPARNPRRAASSVVMALCSLRRAAAARAEIEQSGGHPPRRRLRRTRDRGAPFTAENRTARGGATRQATGILVQPLGGLSGNARPGDGRVRDHGCATPRRRSRRTIPSRPRRRPGPSRPSPRTWGAGRHARSPSSTRRSSAGNRRARLRREACQMRRKATSKYVPQTGSRSQATPVAARRALTRSRRRVRPHSSRSQVHEGMLNERLRASCYNDGR